MRARFLNNAAALGAAIVLALAGCNTIQAIAVKPPARTVYGQGQELDTSGLAVTAHYKKGAETVSDAGLLHISGYDKGRPGNQTVTVTLNARSGLVSSKASDTFTVTVVPVERITVSRPPLEARFRQGDAANWEGLSVAVSFEKDAVPGTAVRPGAGALLISGYDKDRAGTQTITVDYYGKRAAFGVEVIGLEGIAVASPPRKTEYYTGEEIDLSGLVVTGTWRDGSSAPVNITKDNLSGYDITRGGAQNIVVSYSGKSTAFPVTYLAFDALSVDRPPAKTKYELGEALDTAGMRILGTWPGHSLAIVNNARLRITGYDPFRVGEQRVTVTAGGQSDSFTVTVINPFEGAWAGQWKTGSKIVDGKNRDIFTPVVLLMEGNAWLLRTKNSAGEPVEFRGVYTPDSGAHAKLQCADSRGAGDVERDSSTVMRLRNGFMGSEVILNKVR